MLEALRAALAGQKVRPATGEIFTNQRGNVWVKNALTLKWYRILNHAATRPEVIKSKGTGKRMTLNPHGLGLARLGEIPARKIRAAYATLAGRLGGHYRRIDLDELRSVSSLMNDWRDAIKAADLRKESGNINALNIVEGLFYSG